MKMKIGVCVKQVGHVYARTGKDLESLFLSPEDRLFRVGPCDEWAVELALRARESMGKGEVVLLTLGKLVAEPALRRCLAMGADRLYRIETQGPLDPWRKASLMARGIKELNLDLVLCGRESLDTRNGQVGAFLAHRLGRPFLSSIIDLEIREKGKAAAVQRRAGRGLREIVTCRLPAVFSVDVAGEEPRFPKLADKRSAWAGEIPTLHYGEDGEACRVLSVRAFPPRPRPKRVPTPDCRAEAFERIGQLLAGSQGQKRGMILTGAPEEQVEEIVKLLRKHGFIAEGRERKGTEKDGE